MYPLIRNLKQNLNLLKNRQNSLTYVELDMESWMVEYLSVSRTLEDDRRKLQSSLELSRVDPRSAGKITFFSYKKLIFKQQNIMLYCPTLNYVSNIEVYTFYKITKIVYI